MSTLSPQARPPKRSFSETLSTPFLNLPEPSVRRKITADASPAHPNRVRRRSPASNSTTSSSSSSSLHSVSEASALFATDEPVESESVSSGEVPPENDGENGENSEGSDVGTSSADTSSASSSDSDTYSENSSDGGTEVGQTGTDQVVINLPVLPKPAMDSAAEATEKARLLKERVAAFLPQLAAGNAELEAERAAGRLAERNMENVQEGEAGYIEMSLGLGVLEERLDGASETSSSSTSSGDSDCGDGNLYSQRDGGKEKDVMGRLMGRKTCNKAVTIEELDEAESNASALEPPDMNDKPS